jgi:hypothetical protein
VLAFLFAWKTQGAILPGIAADEAATRVAS